MLKKYKVHSKGLVSILPLYQLELCFANVSTLEVIPLFFFLFFVPEILVLSYQAPPQSSISCCGGHSICGEKIKSTKMCVQQLP